MFSRSIRVWLTSAMVFAATNLVAMADQVPVLPADSTAAEVMPGRTIPEPTVVGLVGFVGFLLMMRRRR